VSQWTSPGRIVTGLVSAAALVVALASMTGTQRAQSLGLTRHGALITAQDAGAADAVAAVVVAPGTAGQVLTVSDAGLPHWATAASGGTTVYTYYASDFTAVAGSESASISGTGANSTFTLGVTSNTARTYGSAGVTAARIILALPLGWKRIVAEAAITAVTGAYSSGNRFFTIAVQPEASGIPSLLWGASMPDTGYVHYGNMLNGGSSSVNGTSSYALGADRWFRVFADAEVGHLLVVQGLGVAGARPTTWSAPFGAALVTASQGSLPETSLASHLVVVVRPNSFASANTYTGKITVRVQ
jgi:hypothetical protein